MDRQFPKILSKEAYISEMIQAVEFGFKCHEQGQNLEYARSKFTNIIYE